MKIFVKLLIAVIFVTFSGWAIVAQTKRKPAGQKTAKTSPRDLYVSNCARCHGADGKSQTPKGIEMDADDLTGGVMRRKSLKTLNSVIANGKGEMPGFGKKLSKAEINSLVGYIRTF